MNRVSVGPLLLGVAGVVVVLTVAAAIMLVGSPDAERRRQADRRRVADLQRLSRATDLFWTRRGQLPASIAEIEQEGLMDPASDPLSGAAYGFRAIEGKTYELCASFQGASSDDSPAVEKNFWRHAANRQCFRLEAKTVVR